MLSASSEGTHLAKSSGLSEFQISFIQIHPSSARQYPEGNSTEPLLRVSLSHGNKGKGTLTAHTITSVVSNHVFGFEYRIYMDLGLFTSYLENCNN